MAKTINDFKSNIDNLSRPNRFEVNFFGPDGLKLEGVRCDTAVLPGRNIVTQDFSEYGSFRKYPYLVDYDGGQVQFSFYCDNSFIDRAIIEAWQQSVFDGDFNFNYYKDYIGEVTITQLDQQLEGAVKFTLFEAYPLMIQNQQLDAANADGIQKFNCSFAYRTWESEYIHKPKPFGGINVGSAALQAALDILRLGARNSNRAARVLGRLNNAVGKIERINKKTQRIFGSDILGTLGIGD